MPADGTDVKDHLPPTDPSDLDASSKNIKKSEVAEGKLEIVIADTTATETVEEECAGSSH